MRRLTTSRGFTLVELAVSMAVATLIALATVPMLADAVSNGRLRAGAYSLRSAAQFARSEAVKGNQQVVVEVLDGRSIQISRIDPLTGQRSVVRALTLPDAIQAASASVTYDSAGRPTPFGTDTVIALSGTSMHCGGDIRCPSVHLEPGGAITVCGMEGC